MPSLTEVYLYLLQVGNWGMAKAKESAPVSDLDGLGMGTIRRTKAKKSIKKVPLARPCYLCKSVQKSSLVKLR